MASPSGWSRVWGDGLIATVVRTRTSRTTACAVYTMDVLLVGGCSDAAHFDSATASAARVGLRDTCVFVCFLYKKTHRKALRMWHLGVARAEGAVMKAEGILTELSFP